MDEPQGTSSGPDADTSAAAGWEWPKPGECPWAPDDEELDLDASWSDSSTTVVGDDATSAPKPPLRVVRDTPSPAPVASTDSERNQNSPPLEVTQGGKSYAGQLHLDVKVIPSVRPYRPPDMLPASQRRQWSTLTTPESLDNLHIPKNAFPSTGLYPGFNDWMRPANTPLEFNWAALSVLLGSCLGRAWSIRGEHTQALFPNEFVLVVGTSSTGKGVLGRALEFLCPPAIWSAIDCRSDVGYLVACQEKPHALVFLEEAGILFKKLNLEHFRSAAEYLTRLYDCRDIDTLAVKSVRIHVEDPAVSLLATTIETGTYPRGRVEDAEDTFSGGLMSRFLVCSAPENEKRQLPGMHDLQWGLQVRGLLEKLYTASALAMQAGRVERASLGHDASLEHATWVADRGKCPVPLLDGAWGRAPAHVLKLALAYHIALGRPLAEPIGVEPTIQAIHAVHDYSLVGHAYLAKRATISHFARAVEDFERQLKTHPEGIDFAKAYRSCSSVYRQQFIDVLVALHDEIEYSTWRKKGSRGKSTRVISLRGKVVQRPGETRVNRDVDPPPAVKQILVAFGFISDDWDDDALEEADDPTE